MSREFRVETKHGALRLVCNGTGDTLFVGTDASRLTVRGVNYHVSAHLRLIHARVVGVGGVIEVEKGWRVNPGHYNGDRDNWNYREGLYMTREDYKAVSDAARRTMVEIVEAAANEWAAGPDAASALTASAIEHLEAESERDAEKIRELEREIVALRNAIAHRNARVAALKEE